MSEQIMIVKRDGVEEPLNIEKIHFVVEEACANLAGVSASQIEMNANLQFYNKMSTHEIQKILIRSASDLISLESPNYQYAAARLMSYNLNKQVYGQYRPVPLYDIIVSNVNRGVYDKSFLDMFSKEDIEKLESMIHYNRDENFTYAGLRQIVDKYLVQDRSTGQIFETPQIMYIMIAATMFSQYDKASRMHYIKKYYDGLSLFHINIPTPVNAGVRTPVRQYASCVLVDSDDTLNSIFSSDMAIGRYTALRAGIGINSGRIRGVNSKVRGGEVAHTGVIPFLKKFESTVKCCTQNGVRGGSATVHFPIWHQEIKDILVLKNNKGTEDNRVRKLDYSIQINKTMIERFLSNGNITLFSPHDVPDLYEAYFGDPDVFSKLYSAYEKNSNIKQSVVPAVELFSTLIKEKTETGRLYIMFTDHCNNHSSFLDTVYMSNLCLSGDTIIHAIVNNTEQAITLEQANTHFHNGETIDVLSFNEYTQKSEYKRISNSALTNTSAKVMKITDSTSGKSIICTPEHKVYTENRGYVLAKNLTETDKLRIINNFSQE